MVQMIERKYLINYRRLSSYVALFNKIKGADSSVFLWGKYPFFYPDYTFHNC